VSGSFHAFLNNSGFVPWAQWGPARRTTAFLELLLLPPAMPPSCIRSYHVQLDAATAEAALKQGVRVEFTPDGEVRLQVDKGEFQGPPQVGVIQKLPRRVEVMVGDGRGPHLFKSGALSGVIHLSPVRADAASSRGLGLLASAAMPSPELASAKATVALHGITPPAKSISRTLDRAVVRPSVEVVRYAEERLLELRDSKAEESFVVYRVPKDVDTAHLLVVEPPTSRPGTQGTPNRSAIAATPDRHGLAPDEDTAMAVGDSSSDESDDAAEAARALPAQLSFESMVEQEQAREATPPVPAAAPAAAAAVESSAQPMECDPDPSSVAAPAVNDQLEAEIVRAQQAVATAKNVLLQRRAQAKLDALLAQRSA
jgi:hypothetical protein